MKHLICFQKAKSKAMGKESINSINEIPQAPMNTVYPKLAVFYIFFQLVKVLTICCGVMDRDQVIDTIVKFVSFDIIQPQ